MKNIIYLLTFLATSSIYGQNVLKGSISDKTNDEPLALVNIYIPQIERGTTTDENGSFVIEKIPNGSFKVLISQIGYGTISKEIVFPTYENLTIALSPTAIEIEEIIISTPFHKLQSENVMKVERLKTSDLKQNGAITLASGIENISGVENISTGVGISKPVIRGLSSNRVLVYTQGIRLENQQFGGEHGLGIDDAGIESIEVIKGPASLLYGSDALGGVLYLNPERFANTNKSIASGSITYNGNTQGLSTNLGYKASGDSFKFLFRGNISEHSDYKTKSYRVTNSRFKTLDFKAGLGYQTTQFKTELRYNVNASKLGIPEEIGEQSTSKTPLLPFQKIDNHIFSSKSTVFLKDSKLSFNLGYIYNNRNEFEDEHHHEEDHDEEDEEDEDHDEEDEDAHSDDPALQMKLKTFNYDVKYHLPDFGKFEAIVGVQGMHQTNGNYGEEVLIPDAITNDFGAFATSHIHFERLDIQLGLRFDTRTIDIENLSRKTFNSFNGGLGIKKDFTKNLTARLNIATGFRAPNLAELASDGNHNGANRYEIGNVNLKNEQNLQTDFSLEFKNEHMEVYANAFYNAISNYIFLNPNGEQIDNDPVFLYQQTDANLYGGEFGLHFHPHPLDWLHIESSFETVTGKQKNEDHLPLIPANKLKNTLRVSFSNKTFNQLNAFVKLSTAFNQNNISNFETRTGGYSLTDLGVSGSIPVLKNELSFSVTVNNIFNKEYINHLSRLKVDNIFNMGRNISLHLAYNL